MGTLTKGRYLVLRGLLLLIYCTASVISKGKSCVCPCACVPTLGVYCAVSAFSRSVKEERQLLGAIPVVTHHLSRFLVHVWGLQILPSSHSVFSRWFWVLLGLQISTIWAFSLHCAVELLLLIHQATARAVKFLHSWSFLRLPSNRWQSSHSTKFLVVNESITMTALQSALLALMKARLCNRHAILSESSRAGPPF